MSSSRMPRARIVSRVVSAVAGCVSLAILSGCQVSPLYADTPEGLRGNALIRSVAIDPADNRLEQQVRNELIFLLNGGAPETTTPRYRVELTVLTTTQGILRDPDDSSPTGETIVFTAQYRLLDAATERELAARTQMVTTRYDSFEQEFADIRAQRDAENRAARELAERIRGELTLLLRDEGALGTDQGA